MIADDQSTSYHLVTTHIKRNVRSFQALSFIWVECKLKVPSALTFLSANLFSVWEGLMLNSQYILARN